MKRKVFTRPVSVTLSEEAFKQIYEIAEKKETSMSEIIREAIQDRLNKNDGQSTMDNSLSGR